MNEPILLYCQRCGKLKKRGGEWHSFSALEDAISRCLSNFAPGERIVVKVEISICPDCDHAKKSPKGGKYP